MNEFLVETDGALSIELRAGDPTPWWWDLRLNGDPITVIGGSCGTCEALFENIKYTQGAIGPADLAEQLNAGIGEVSAEVLQLIQPLLLAGGYWAHVIETKPLPSGKGVPPGVGCKAKHFWWRQFEESPKHRLYELMLPSTVITGLDQDRVAWYQERIKQGHRPTALALTVFDERVFRAEYREGALAHFILDGHHKIAAAGILGAPIRVASLFLIRSRIAWLGPGLYESSLRTYYESGVPPKCPPELLTSMTRSGG